MKVFTLGSLFDGIGVFPLAASRYGIIPAWASEVEKSPVTITKRHFPTMLHLGDITKIDGGKIPPVHIITFGSPCQDLSNIGKRAHVTSRISAEKTRGEGTHRPSLSGKAYAKCRKRI